MRFSIIMMHVWVERWWISKNWIKIHENKMRVGSSRLKEIYCVREWHVNYIKHLYVRDYICMRFVYGMCQYVLCNACEQWAYKTVEMFVLNLWLITSSLTHFFSLTRGSVRDFYFVISMHYHICILYNLANEKIRSSLYKFR